MDKFSQQLERFTPAQIRAAFEQWVYRFRTNGHPSFCKVTTVIKRQIYGPR